MSRMINIVLTELASDIMKHEEEMEVAINSKEPLNVRLQQIKLHLGEIVKTEMMIEKWRNYTSTPKENNKIG